jgi:transcriptional regulator with XRE-family HTH domain
MTATQWQAGRKKAGFTQVAASLALGVTQPYLSQLETGLRAASLELAFQATKLYKLSPTAVPLPDSLEVQSTSPDELERKLASLGYPGFAHVSSETMSNPAEVVLSAVVTPDLDTRLVESLPWVLSAYTDMDWPWLRDRAKVHNAQNRLGYLVHLAAQGSRSLPTQQNVGTVLSQWKEQLEEARLEREGTLCRDSMPEPERRWLRENRPDAAAHWKLLTSLTADQLAYAQ